MLLFFELAVNQSLNSWGKQYFMFIGIKGFGRCLFCKQLQCFEMLLPFSSEGYVLPQSCQSENVITALLFHCNCCLKLSWEALEKSVHLILLCHFQVCLTGYFCKTGKNVQVFLRGNSSVLHLQTIQIGRRVYKSALKQGE